METAKEILTRVIDDQIANGAEVIIEHPTKAVETALAEWHRQHFMTVSNGEIQVHSSSAIFDAQLDGDLLGQPLNDWLGQLDWSECTGMDETKIHGLS